MNSAWVEEELEKLSNGSDRVATLARCVRFIFNAINSSDSPTGFQQKVLQMLKSMEDTLAGQDAVLARIEGDAVQLKQLAVDLTAAFTASASAQADANARLEKDIADLRNEIGSGNVTRLTAIADSMEANLSSFKNVQTLLEANAAAENALDVPVIPVISPNGGTVPAGGQLQFSAQVAVQWSCNPTIGGSIDTNGLYTAPATPGVGDTITAMSTDGKQTTSSVSVSIV